MVDPSLVPITQWRPDTAKVGKAEPMDAGSLAAFWMQTG